MAHHIKDHMFACTLHRCVCPHTDTGDPPCKIPYSDLGIDLGLALDIHIQKEQTKALRDLIYAGVIPLFQKFPMPVHALILYMGSTTPLQSNSPNTPVVSLSHTALALSLVHG